MLTKRQTVASTTIGILVFLQSACTLTQREFQRFSLPQKLHTTWFYAEGHCSQFPSYQGAFAFGLRQETVEAIDRQGISFFSDIGLSANRARHHYFGGEWRQTPVSTGASFNLDCGAQHSWLWPKGISEALAAPGSYYQSAGGRSVFIIPSLRLVVANASDR